MKTISLVFPFLLLPAAILSAAVQTWSVSDPTQSLTFEISLADGQLSYRFFDSQTVYVEPSPLGIQTQTADLSRNLSFVSQSRCETFQSYFINHGKKSHYENRGNSMTLTFSSPEGILLHTEVQVYPDGAAFRYSGNWGDTTITKENTAFKIKPGVRAWMQTYDKPLGGAPAYEKPYSRVISGTSADKIRTNNGWCLPALFEPAAGRFLLIADADVRENYCGIRLESKCDNGLYRVRFPADGDAKGYGNVYPSVSGAFSSPWRVLIAGDLTTVFGSTLVTDVSAPLDPIFNGIYPGWVKPGRSAWNWGHYHNIRYRSGFKRELKSAAEAARLGWEYSLVDANWNTWGINPYKKVKELVDAAGNVGIWLWYNSGGKHNSVTEAPRNKMTDREIRRAEMKKLSEIGIKGLKIDFFHSEKQDMIRYYMDILKDAAEAKLMINFHGCALPKGWERRFPNLMTSEAVFGGEQYHFGIDAGPHADENLYFVFTRNVTASMDYTPVIFEPYYLSSGATYGHSLAQAVMFESGIVHYADTVHDPDAGYQKIFALYPEVRIMMEEIPADWDESVLIEGDPDTHAVVARRKGNRWFLAGFNALPEKKTVSVEWKQFTGEGKTEIIVVEDGKRADLLKTQTLPAADTPVLTVTMDKNGGFTALIR